MTLISEVVVVGGHAAIFNYVLTFTSAGGNSYRHLSYFDVSYHVYCLNLPSCSAIYGRTLTWDTTLLHCNIDKYAI